MPMCILQNHLGIHMLWHFQLLLLVVFFLVGVLGEFLVFGFFSFVCLFCFSFAWLVGGGFLKCIFPGVIFLY